jgi:uncharacterized DUF497 family protein
MQKFEWDDNKAASNLRKHGISFQTAARVFTDPFLQPKVHLEPQIMIYSIPY